MDDRVVENTERNLWIHVNLFEDIGYPFGKMILYIGSGAGGKKMLLKDLKIISDNFLMR